MKYSLDVYLEMLTFMRPAFTPYDDAFIDRYLRPLNPSEDKFGNLWIDVGTSPTVIWSSHTDTVHNTSGLQEVLVNKQTNVVRLANHKKKKKWQHSSYGDCLGADCTTGVFIMMNMIEAGIPGRYIFHRAEESGAEGSRDILKNRPDLLKGINAAIAFDRKGFNEIITEQGTYITASDEFAKSFATKLGKGYKPSPYGSFTDTKIYAGVIPECTNIAVGYMHQHTSSESQDLNHLSWLTETMCKFDASDLVIHRKPEPEPVYNWRRNVPQSPPKCVYDLIVDYPQTLSRILEGQGVTFDALQKAITAEQMRTYSTAVTNNLV